MPTSDFYLTIIALIDRIVLSITDILLSAIF